MSGLLPNATWVQNARSGGGTYQHGPWRIVLHTIEGALGTLSSSLPASHQFPPHVWYDPSTRRLYQTVPLDRSAFALYQGNGPWTNKASALQVEIAGAAASAGDWPDSYLQNLAVDVVVPLCRWVAQQGGRINLDNVPPVGTIGGSASEYAPQRLSYDAWNALDGLCSHRHVPDNDHWDTGTMNIPRLVQIAKGLLGGTFTPASIREEDMPLNAKDLEAVDALIARGASNTHLAVSRDVGDMIGGLRQDMQALTQAIRQMQPAAGGNVDPEQVAAAVLRQLLAKAA